MCRCRGRGRGQSQPRGYAWCFEFSFPHEKAPRVFGAARTGKREERSERAWRAAPSAVLDPAPSAVVRQLSISAALRRGVGGTRPRPSSTANAPPGPAHIPTTSPRTWRRDGGTVNPRHSPPSLHHYQRDRRRTTTTTTTTTRRRRCRGARRTQYGRDGEYAVPFLRSVKRKLWNQSFHDSL